MAAFVAPFAGLFWWRHRRQIAAANPHFNYFFERFLLSRESNALITTWAAAEAIVWFVIPEFLLIMMVFMKVQRKFELVKYDLIGTVIGTILALAIAMPKAQLLAIPYVHTGMIEQVEVWYQQYGVWGIFAQPFSGVPYKVFNALAPHETFSLVAFIGLAVIARMMRYLIIYQIAKGLYPLLHRFVYRHYGILVVIVIMVFTALLMQVSHKYAESVTTFSPEQLHMALSNT